MNYPFRGTSRVKLRVLLRPSLCIPANFRCLRVARGLLLVGLGLYLIFAHGCHGKEDADLLIRSPCTIVGH